MKAIHVLTVVTTLVLLATGLASASSDITRPRQVLGSGASVVSASAGGVFIQATLGQPIVGSVSAPGDLALGQGFWYEGMAPHRIYLPLILRSEA